VIVSPGGRSSKKMIPLQSHQTATPLLDASQLLLSSALFTCLFPAPFSLYVIYCTRSTVHLLLQLDKKKTFLWRPSREMTAETRQQVIFFPSKNAEPIYQV